MFEQFRNVVESLATHDPDSEPAHDNKTSAESALTNLRKSFASQRPHSRTGSPIPKTPTTGKKLSLDDRLRASLTTANASIAHRPNGLDATPRATPSPPQRSASPMLSNSTRPMSPSSVPLPGSPVLSPVPENLIPGEPPSAAEHMNNSEEATQHEMQVGAEEEKGDAGTNPATVTAAEGDTIVNLRQAPPADVESLQERLKLVEQRFLDVSESFKKLQADRAAADAVIKELTSLQSLQDINAFSDYLKSIISKDSLHHNEVKGLEAKMQKKEELIQEITEKRHVESRAQSELIERLQSQVSETEALFKASLDASSQAQESREKQKDEAQKLQAEIDQARNLAKEEEEKRVKAITLLKTVRQKLVKTEKERDDALKEVASFKDREQGNKDKELADKVRLQDELDAVRADKEKTLNRFRAQFDKEISGLKERHERELSALRGQLELDSVTLKASHTKELSQKTSQIATLEASLNNTTRDKNRMFDQLQMRQAEAESIQSHLESLQNQNTELQHQLRESQDRIALLTHDIHEAQREQESRLHQATVPPEEVARLLSSTELKYESKLTEIKDRIRQMEIERNEGEEQWSRKLHDKAKEVDDLKILLESGAALRDDLEKSVNQLQTKNAEMLEEIHLGQQKLSGLLSAEDRISTIENSAKEQEEELRNDIRSLEQQREETHARETQLRLSNKTLRDELRKVQSSIALLERQRSPGISWSQRPEDNAPGEPRTSGAGSRPDSPSATLVSPKSDQDINVEYLRNVILQFLEHKEMRPNLTRIISTLLRFTPQETRRLMSKV